MSKNRVEAFSDGVFAIVVTLLVLDLRPSEGILNAHGMIVQAIPKMLTFTLSFIVIGTYWVAHHRMLHYVKTTDRTFLWLNLALLMVVTFIPYPTALIGATRGEADAVLLYGVTLIAANLLGTLLWLYGTSSAHRAENLERGQRSRVALVHLAPVVIYAIGMSLTPFAIAITFACYAAVPVFFILAGPWVDQLLANTEK